MFSGFPLKYCYRVIGASVPSFAAVRYTSPDLPVYAFIAKESAVKHKAPKHLPSRLSA